MDIRIVDNSLNEFTCEEVGGAEGFEYSETRPIIDDIPARDGALYIGSRFGRRPLSWQGFIRGLDVFERRRSLIRVCKVGELKTIEFTTFDGLELQAEVEILGLIMPYQKKAVVYLIEAVAPDPRFYSQELISETTEITEAEGGVPIPAAIPAPIGGGSSINFTLNNEGNTDTNPIFVIHGPGSDFVVQNTTTGEQFHLDLELTNTESVAIDTNLRTVIKGASQNVFGSFSGDWMVLRPGNNIIIFNGGAGVDVETSLTVNYRHSYLGI